MKGKRRVAIMTGGGDCPGLNAAIRAAAKSAIRLGYEVVGICDGWKGFLDNETVALDDLKTSGIIDRGGTILGTSRVSPRDTKDGPRRILDSFRRLGLDGLVVLGGEGTLAATYNMYEAGLPVVGIPKTIDNDVRETDYAIGFQTAVQIATDALDRLRSTAESHHRVMLLEVMGREAGWIAVYSGMANGADAILIPEIPLTAPRIDELCRMIKRRDEKGKRFSIVVVAEGTRLPGIARRKPAGDDDPPVTACHLVGDIIEKTTGLETRITNLGYVQRGGTPVAFDRSLATSFGVKAIELIATGDFGMMTALRGLNITSAPLAKVAVGAKPLRLGAYRVAEIFFG